MQPNLFPLNLDWSSWYAIHVEYSGNNKLRILNLGDWKFGSLCLGILEDFFMELWEVRKIYDYLHKNHWSEGDQPWDFFGRNDAKAEAPVLWPPHAKSWLIGKDSDAGRDWGQEEKGTTEDEMAGWHHRLNGRESEWTPGVGDGQGGLVCCASWGRKESDTTERLISSENHCRWWLQPWN